MSEHPERRAEDASTSLQLEYRESDEFSKDEERALLRKIDRRLIPCVWIMYLLSYASTLNRIHLPKTSLPAPEFLALVMRPLLSVRLWG